MARGKKRNKRQYSTQRSYRSRSQPARLETQNFYVTRPRKTSSRFSQRPTYPTYRAPSFGHKASVWGSSSPVSTQIRVFRPNPFTKNTVWSTNMVHNPKTVCESRSTRKQVLHAKNVAGSNGFKKKIITKKTKERC